MPPGGQQDPKKRIKGINSATTWPWFCRKIMLCSLEFREKLSGKSITQLVQISSLQRVLFPGTQKYYCTPLFLGIQFLPPPATLLASSCCFHPGTLCSSYSTLFPGLKHHVLSSQLCMGCPLSLQGLKETTFDITFVPSDLKSDWHIVKCSVHVC